VGKHLVYLLHFDRPYGSGRYGKASHYLGTCTDLEARLQAHRCGRGARLIEVITAAGIGFVVARTWEGGRGLERRLKNRKNSPRLCPICRQSRRAEVNDHA